MDRAISKYQRESHIVSDPSRSQTGRDWIAFQTRIGNANTHFLRSFTHPGERARRTTLWPVWLKRSDFVLGVVVRAPDDGYARDIRMQCFDADANARQGQPGCNQLFAQRSGISRSPVSIPGAAAANHSATELIGPS
jgi:hypothetical protein